MRSGPLETSPPTPRAPSSSFPRTRVQRDVSSPQPAMGTLVGDSSLHDCQKHTAGLGSHPAHSALLLQLEPRQTESLLLPVQVRLSNSTATCEDRFGGASPPRPRSSLQGHHPGQPRDPVCLLPGALGCRRSGRIRPAESRVPCSHLYCPWPQSGSQMSGGPEKPQKPGQLRLEPSRGWRSWIRTRSARMMRRIRMRLGWGAVQEANATGRWKG